EINKKMFLSICDYTVQQINFFRFSLATGS
ncbi:MAG: hypothetical protein ACI9AT_002159, partial [Ulvibacter sp.]